MAPETDHRQLTLPLLGPSLTLGSPENDSAGRLRRVVLSGELCHFRLRRARRRTIGFQIDDQGLTVSAPRWVSLREIEEAIVEKERWIRSKLAQWQEWRARHGAHRLRWADGAVLPYLGGELTLRLGSPNATPAVQVARELRLALPVSSSETEVRTLAQEWFRQQALDVLGERIDGLAARGGVRPFTWRLSAARTQWGSCNEDGRIRLNWRLVFFPIPVIDYVVAHELAHLTALNHGPAFWREVERLLPDFRAARDQIRDEELAALPL
jgi:predicted metal-dependent hydrolase